MLRNPLDTSSDDDFPSGEAVEDIMKTRPGHKWNTFEIYAELNKKKAPKQVTGNQTTITTEFAGVRMTTHVPPGMTVTVAPVGVCVKRRGINPPTYPTLGSAKPHQQEDDKKPKP